MNYIDRFLNLLYPPRCLLCRKLLRDNEENLCRKCRQILPRLLNNESRRDIDHVRTCISPFYYKDEVRESLHRYKFRRIAAYGRIYAEFIVKSIDEKAISCDIISWVPISRKRLRERGYDQSEIIARALSKKLGVPSERLLVKIKDTPRQSSLTSREERKRNVKGAYQCIAQEELIGKRVLLIDDIVTTGATVSECASMLAKAGCNEIYVAAAAMKM